MGSKQLGTGCLTMIEQRISVVAPCLNEEDNVRVLYSRLASACLAHGIDFELVLVDDGSTDQTWPRCLELRNSHPDNVVCVQHEVNKGIPGAWETGVANARGEYICLIDSDLQNPPECVVDLYKAMIASQSDIARGVRVPTNKEQPLRVLMSKSLNLVLNLSFRMKSSDNKSGFVLGPSVKMARIIDHSGQYKHFQTFIGVSAHCQGFSVVEVPTPFDRRHSGTSFLAGKSITTVLGVLSDIKEARREFIINRKVSI